MLPSVCMYATLGYVMLSIYVVITGIERQACYQMRGTVGNSTETIFYQNS